MGGVCRYIIKHGFEGLKSAISKLIMLRSDVYSETSLQRPCLGTSTQFGCFQRLFCTVVDCFVLFMLAVVEITTTACVFIE